MHFPLPKLDPVHVREWLNSARYLDIYEDSEGFMADAIELETFRRAKGNQATIDFLRMIEEDEAIPLLVAVLGLSYVDAGMIYHRTMELDDDYTFDCYENEPKVSQHIIDTINKLEV